ncbi:MAG: TIGR02117 family protein [Flavobacterium sp.]|uniref:TIGR02117 family protein n=1 Tax=Flavobacterium sp. TaxID=239 RepID=UPI003262D555
MKTIKKSLSLFFKAILGFVVFLIVYSLSAFGLSKITVNAGVTQKEEIEIFIKTNGVHTDIIVPIKNEIKDWSKEIKFNQTKSRDSLMNYLAIGWGDKGFYLDTPQWSDLKTSTAFKAATGLSTSAIHTTFYKSVSENESCKRILISKENYQKLVTFINDSFQRDSDKNLQCILGRGYAKNDSFYEAKGSYSLFKTCNTWANEVLKSSNQKAAFWTPYDGGIFCHYQ